jgi:hypothetical protein
MGRKVLAKHAAKICFRRARRRAVVIGQIEVRNPTIEGAQHDLPGDGIAINIAKVVPRPSEMRGSISPLRPQRAYFISSYPAGEA